ncbi:hypothetical protein NB311A_13396 [Nitrobacter sp. Nb-311A]|nr:hypothetical protein NB311A_13396 [Nitrobacter sp. Nb-311A]
MVLLDHILPEARTLIDTQYAGYPASDGSDCPSNRTTDRSRRSFTFASASFHASNHALGYG